MTMQDASRTPSIKHLRHSNNPAQQNYFSSLIPFQPLLTKIRPPSLPLKHVSRPFLVSTLNHNITQYKLTLLTSSPGFGKTTLLSEWCADPPETALPYAWLSLDERDNDPKHFFAYLLFALQCVHLVEDFNHLLPPSPHEALSETNLSYLLNEITISIPYDFVLILDQYHCITSTAIHKAILFLLEYAPANVHFVIAGRTPPPFPLARLRAQARLIELGDKELRFQLSEASQFLKEKMQVSLSDEQVATLNQRTEGWITALQLAAYALRKQEGEGIDRLIHSFSGNHHYILDYLTAETFHQQSTTIQTILMQTSILDRLNPSLCAAVIDENDGYAILDTLEKTGLFLIPIDGEEGWYRYHRCFRDFLYHLLTRTSPDILPELHYRASIWFELQGEYPSAIEHALAASDFERAIALLGQVASHLLTQGHFLLLLNWLIAIPDEYILAHPLLCLVYIWSMIFRGYTSNVEKYLRSVKLSAAPQSASSPNRNEKIDEAYWQAASAAVHCYLANIQGRIHDAIESASYALKHLPVADFPMRVQVVMVAGVTVWLTGKEAEAIPYFEQAYRDNLAAGSLPFACTSAWVQAKLYIIRGYLHQGMELLQQALQIIEQLSPNATEESLLATGMLWLGIGNIYRYWNNKELSIHYLTKGLELCSRWDGIGLAGPAMIDGMLTLALFRLEQGQEKEAQEIIYQAEQYVHKYSLHFYTPLSLRIFQKRFKPEGGAQLTQFILSKVPTSFLYELDQMVDIRFFLQQKEYDRALNILAPLLEQAQAANRRAIVLELRLLQALAYEGKRDSMQAGQALCQALADGASDYFIQPFLAQEQAMYDLLVKVLDLRNKTPQPDWPAFPLDYALNILDAFKADKQAIPAQHESGKAFQEKTSIEQLTPKEQEVVKLAIQGYSNSEIARKMCLEVCTVRWHMKNIYGKLQVHNRIQLALKVQEAEL